MEHGDPNDGSPMSSGISEIQGHGDGVQDPLTNLAFWSVFQQILLQNNIFCPKMIRQIVFNANGKKKIIRGPPRVVLRLFHQNQSSTNSTRTNSRITN